MKSNDIMQSAYNSMRSLGKLRSLSPLYVSTAWPDPQEPEYINAVAVVETSLAPEAFLAGLLAIEAAFGRVRSADPDKRYAPRSLDLDLVSHGEAQMATEDLSLPHPRMQERGFVLFPLADIWPDWEHPVTGETATGMAAKIDEPGTRRLVS